MLTSWDNKFLELAQSVSIWSKDPSTKIGVVAVNPEKKQILSTGYNGFPRGIVDTTERLNVRSIKYQLVVHGEQNCIYNACLNGTCLNGSTFYIYGLPCCSECAKGLIQVGVKRVITKYPKTTQAKWIESTIMSNFMFDEVGIEHSYVCY
jgi:dCMP deaminase